MNTTACASSTPIGEWSARGEPVPPADPFLRRSRTRAIAEFGRATASRERATGRRAARATLERRVLRLEGDQAKLAQANQRLEHAQQSVARREVADGPRTVDVEQDVNCRSAECQLRVIRVRVPGRRLGRLSAQAPN